MENAAMLDLCSRYFSASCVQWMEAVDPVLVSTMFRSISDARRQAKQQPGRPGGTQLVSLRQSRRCRNVAGCGQQFKGRCRSAGLQKGQKRTVDAVDGRHQRRRGKRARGPRAERSLVISRVVPTAVWEGCRHALDFGPRSYGCGTARRCTGDGLWVLETCSASVGSGYITSWAL